MAADRRLATTLLGKWSVSGASYAVLGDAEELGHLGGFCRRQLRLVSNHCLLQLLHR